MRRAGIAFALVAALAAPAAAQRSVSVVGPTDNPLRDGIPAFTIIGSGFVSADLPLRFTLQVNSYLLLMTDTYPKWGTGAGTSPPAPGSPLPPPGG